jgi:hypothetical protein
MAHSRRRAAVAERKMGHDYSFPALHISFKRWCKTFVSGEGRLNEERYKKGLAAKDFFLALLNADCPKVAVENPVSSKVFEMPKHTQEVEPYMFGDPWKKKTRLWLRGLPKLEPTDICLAFKIATTPERGS